MLVSTVVGFNFGRPSSTVKNTTNNQNTHNAQKSNNSNCAPNHAKTAPIKQNNSKLSIIA